MEVATIAAHKTSSDSTGYLEIEKPGSRKAHRTYPLKRRSRAKSHTTKTLALVEATSTQLTNTVRDAHTFNATKSKTTITNPLKRPSRAKSARDEVPSTC